MTQNGMVPAKVVSQLDARHFQALVMQSQAILAQWLDPMGLDSDTALVKLLQLLDNTEAVRLLERNK